MGSAVQPDMRKGIGKGGKESGRLHRSAWIRHKQVGLGLLDLLAEEESPVDVDLCARIKEK